MNKSIHIVGAVLVALAVAAPAVAKDKTPRAFVVNNEAVGVPVFPHDITDRPYEVIGEVKAGVRKATIFSAEPSQEKIYKELWERADKLKADAVVKVTYGDSHVTAFSWGKTNAVGTAVRFTAAPAAAAAAPAVAADPAPVAAPAVAADPAVTAPPADVPAPTPSAAR